MPIIENGEYTFTAKFDENEVLFRGVENIYIDNGVLYAEYPTGEIKPSGTLYTNFTCTSASGAEIKKVSHSLLDEFISTGVFFTIIFTNTNTHLAPKLQINNRTALPIKYNGVSASKGDLFANRVYLMVYEDTEYRIIGSIEQGRKYNSIVGDHSFVSGNDNIASGKYSVAEGDTVTASGESSRADGKSTIASGQNAHAEGDTTVASGLNSHAEGLGSTAKTKSQHVSGEYNSLDTQGSATTRGKFVEIVGNGTSSSRSNAYALEWTGTGHYKGDLYVNADADSANGKKVATEEYVQYHSDALIYKGIVNSNNELPVKHERGWMYKVGTDGTYANHICEVGDVLICNTDGTSVNDTHWDAVQSGDKSVTSSTIASSNNRISVYDGTSGKMIKQTSIVIDTNNGDALTFGRTGDVGASSIAYGLNVIASGAESIATGVGAQATGSYSHAEGNSTIASNSSAHAEGLTTTASGIAAHAEGGDTTASGQRSHAEGTSTTASGAYSHAEGNNTTATGQSSHAEGYLSETTGAYSHAEGSENTANGQGSHAEGCLSASNGDYSHAEGYQTSTGNSNTPAGHSAHAEGNRSQAKGDASHAEGYITIALGNNAHAEGNDTSASYANSHAEGFQTTASANGAHAEGHSVVIEGQNTSQRTVASGLGSHAEGGGSLADGTFSHAENELTKAYGESSHAEGYKTTTGEVNTEKGKYAHAEGLETIASGDSSHAEGTYIPGLGVVPSAYTTASGEGSHAEGAGTTASGLYSHAEGERSSATAEASHAEGQSYATGILSHAEGASTASGLNAHAEGSNTEASGSFSHAENWGNFAIGDCSHAEGRGTLVKRYAQHSFGAYNVADETGVDESAKGKYIEIVGNGEGVNAKSNARTLDWDGNERIMGDLYTGCNADSTGGTKLGDALALKAPLVSPVLTGTPRSVTPTSSSNAKMIATKEYVDNAFTTFDAMLYKGVVNQNSDLPATHKQGWTYKVGTAGTYVGVVCEVGDMILCNTDGTSANNSHWNIIQTNIDGAVIGPASSTTNHIALFNGTTGKVIKDGGTIQSLIIDDSASGSGVSSKVWSAQKSINELAKKVNETDLFAGIDIYDPNSASQGQFVFNTDAYAHQIGTNCIVHNTDEGVYVIPPANLVDSCLSYETLTLTEYIQRIADNTIDDTSGNGNTGKTWSADKIYDQLALKAPKASPVFTGSISLGRYSENVGNNSMAVGYQTSAAGQNSVAFGQNTYASDNNQFVFGCGNVVYQVQAWDETKTYHPGEWASRGGSNYECRTENTNIAPPNSTYWYDRGSRTSNYIEIVGNGSWIVPSNARTLDWSGNEWLAGTLTLGSTTLTEAKLQELINLTSATGVSF